VSTQWEVHKVAAESDTSRLDHLCLVRWKVWAVQVLSAHLGYVLSPSTVSMQVVDDGVKEVSEGIVRVVRSSKDSHFSSDVLAASVDSLLEGEAALVLDVMVLVPQLLVHDFSELTSSALREGRHVLYHVLLRDPRAA